MKAREHALWLCLMVILVAALAAAFDLPRDAAEAHKYADGVLVPRFTAAVNDWAYQHPQDRKAGSWDHVQTLHAGDVERYRAVREAWRDLDHAMKRAGY